VLLFAQAHADGAQPERELARQQRHQLGGQRGVLGHHLGQRLGEWTSSYGSSATKQKVYVAKTTKYFGKVGVGEFAVESGELKVGDEIIITGPTTGLVRFVVEEIRVDMEPVEKAVKGQLCSIAVPEKVRPGDRLYLFTDRKVMQ